MQHTSPISGIAVYSDEYVATAGYDNQIILWDQRTGSPITRGLHDHLANQCAFSPDGSLLVTSSSDYTARLWSVPDLSLRAIFNAHDDDVEMSVFHPEQPMVATASRDHRLRVYDLSGALLATFEGHKADVISVEWGTDGDEIITSSDDGTVKRWSLRTGTLVENVDLGGVETDTVVISPDGRLFAGNDLGEIVVIGPRSTERVRAHDAGIKRLVLEPQRQLIVSLSYDRTMRMWDVSGDLPVQTVEATFPADVWPRSCAFATGDRLVFGTFGATYRTFDFGAQRWLDQNVPPTGGANAVAVERHSVWTVGDAGQVTRDGVAVVDTGSLCNFLTPLSDRVVTGGQLGRVMDASTGSVLHEHRSPLNCGARMERDGGEHVVVGAYTGEGIVLRVEKEGLRHIQDVVLHENAVKGVAVGGGLIFSVCADQSVAWHDVATLREVHRITTAHDRIANDCVALGSFGFASVGRDLMLRIWNSDFHCDVVGTPLRHSLKCIAASEDGRHIAVGTYDGHLAVYDRAERGWTGSRRVSASGLSCLTFDPSRREFLVSSYDGNVYRQALGR